MAYKILFFFKKKKGDKMKEIGEALKEARENTGLSIDEVASDLKLRPSQIENIENGNAESFKDVFYLKYLIRDYSKYLGLNYEDMIDEFNEYLFDHTSKISLEDIKKANKKITKKEKKENRVASPYTLNKRKKLSLKNIILVVVIILLIISIMIIFDKIEKKEVVEVNTSIIK